MFSIAISLKCQSEMNYWESSNKDKPHTILNVLGLKLKYCLQFKYSHSNHCSSLFIMPVQQQKTKEECHYIRYQIRRWYPTVLFRRSRKNYVCKVALYFLKSHCEMDLAKDLKKVTLLTAKLRCRLSGGTTATKWN